MVFRVSELITKTISISTTISNAMSTVGVTKILLAATTGLVLLGYLIGVVMLVQGQLEIEQGQSVATSDGIYGMTYVKDINVIEHGQRSCLWGSIILTCMTGLFFIPVLLSIVLVYERMRD